MTDTDQGTVLTFKKDAYIIVEGQRSDYFFIIQEGNVQLSREAEVVKERDGNILGPGDFFGVVAAMASHDHIETAQAITDVTLLGVQESQFDAFIQDNTAMAMHIITQFSNRMRYLNNGLTQITFNTNTEEEQSICIRRFDRPASKQPVVTNDTEEEASHLFTVGKYYDKTEDFSHAYYAYRQYLKYCPKGEHTTEAKKRLRAVSSYAKSVPFITEGNKRTYTADTVLYAQGEPGEELYVIQSGSVKITKIINDNEILLAVLRAGDFVGEMAILESKPRSVTAVVYEEATLITISRDNFPTVVTSNPQIIKRLIKSLAERIWFLYKQLANTTMVDPVARIYDALVIQMEKNRISLDLNDEYTFDFGLKELVALTGMPEEEADKAIQKIMRNPTIKIIDNKIHTVHIGAIKREYDYYKNIERRRKAFQKKK